MADKTYIYYGPMSGVTLPADEAHPKGRQILFIPGGRVTAPDDNDYIKSLAARGYLEPVTDPGSETAGSKTATASKIPESPVSRPAAQAAKPAAASIAAQPAAEAGTSAKES